MTVKLLNIQTNPAAMCEEIEQFIRSSMKHLNRKGAVIGLSGGLDSSVVAMLAVRSLGKEKTRLLYMPEKDSNPIHHNHAKMLASHLGQDLSIVDISSNTQSRENIPTSSPWSDTGAKFAYTRCRIFQR